MLEREDKKNLRRGVAVLLISMAILALISNHAERVWDAQDKIAVTNQLTQLLLASKNQATTDDIKTLDSHFADGVAQIVAAIKGVKPPPPVKITPKLEPILPPALQQTTIVSQRRIPSNDPQSPYAVEVTFQTNVQISPVGLAFHCTGAVDSLKFFVIGQGVYMNVKKGFLDGATRTVPYLKFSFPPVTPESPLVVNLYSKENISVTQIEQIH